MPHPRTDSDPPSGENNGSPEDVSPLPDPAVPGRATWDPDTATPDGLARVGARTVLASRSNLATGGHPKGTQLFPCAAYCGGKSVGREEPHVHVEPLIEQHVGVAEARARLVVGITQRSNHPSTTLRPTLVQQQQRRSLSWLH